MFENPSAHTHQGLRFGSVAGACCRAQIAAVGLRPSMATVRRQLSVAMLAGLLAGCSIFGSSDNGNAPSTDQTASSQGAAGTATSKPATTAAPAQQQPVASGLVSDQQNTAYSDQPLTALSEQSSAPPPQQVTTVTPATTSDTGSASAQTAATTGDAEPATSSTASTATEAEASATPPAQAPASLPPPVQPPPAAPQLATAPQPTTGITPLAPPPNPLPPATQMTSASPPESTGSVSVDQSQLGGAVPQQQLYSAPYAPPYGAPSTGVMTNGTAYGAAPISLPPPGAPIAVVFFGDGSSSISARAMGVLRNVALIQQQLGGQLRIIGHASARTAAVTYSQHMSINQRLSEARANAVARALIGFGAVQGTISVAAVGSQQPVYAEIMPTGEAGNRRVEVYLDGPSAPAMAVAQMPAQPATVANGSVTVDLGAIDQTAPAGGYYAGSQAPSYALPGSNQLADSSYGSSPGQLLYPPLQGPVSVLTVPPPPGAEPYVAEQPQAPAQASGTAAAAPASSTASAAETTTAPESTTPAVPPPSTGSAASSSTATTMEQTTPTDMSGTSTQTGSVAATTASGTDAGTSAGTSAATDAGTSAATGSGTQPAATAADTGTTATTGSGTQQVTTGTSTQQAAAGTATDTGTATAAAPSSATTTASTSGEAVQTVPAPPPADGQVRIAFQKDSAEIPDAARSELDGLAQQMTANGNMRVELLAYASGTADTATQARRLSLLRALAVRSYLIKQGVESTRMDVRALGNKVEGEPFDRVDLLPKSS